MIKTVPIINHSGYPIKCPATIRPLRSNYYRVVSKSVTGDAPKDFIRVYSHGIVHRSNVRRWPAYIAKVGHKYYPAESITEHLMTRIGQALGIEMAHSCLMSVKGQIRFLSRYFLKPAESLVHGAEIFANYLNDTAFVHQVESLDESRNLFTFQTAVAAIEKIFSEDSSRIIREFVKMLGFDAIVGNNDRHFYNWGVIIDTNFTSCRFSPVFDTARGLLWNRTELQLEGWQSDPNVTVE